LDDTNHYSAFFELLLHELMLSLNLNVSLPDITSSSKKAPDFRVGIPEAGQFIHLEATIKLTCPSKLRPADARVRDALDALNELHSPDYFFDITQYGSPTKGSVRKALASRIQPFIDAQCYENVLLTLENGDYTNLPRIHFSFQGWHLSLRLWPKHKLRGMPGILPLASWTPALPVLSPLDAIRLTLKEKATRYELRSLPYVIAMNMPRSVFPWQDAVQALFGSRDREGAECAKGAWHETSSKSGYPRYRGVSGLLLFHAVEPWNVGSDTEWVFIQNPNAEHPVSERFTSLLPKCAPEHVPLFQGPSIPLNELIRSIPSAWPSD
jgi:hypothetical protein